MAYSPTHTPEALRALLSGAVDYAGLFPPASLPLPETLARYGTYAEGPEAWALGRLVLPASRLADLPPSLAPARRWDVSILIGNDVDGDLRQTRALAQRRPGFRVASLEGAASGREALPGFAARVGRAAADLQAVAYVELPLTADLGPALDAVRDHGLRAKARTGGIAAAAIPEPRLVLAFLRAAFDRELPFKLTAGLHHAVRGPRALTYEPHAATATMHGFLNVLMAAALLAARTPAAGVEAALHEGDGRAFRFEDGTVTWGEHRAGLGDIRRARERLVSFGSCSFEEPVQELKALGLA